jgi:heat shock protein HtpX
MATTDAVQAQVAENRKRVALLLGAVAGAVFVMLWLVLAVVGLPLVGLVVAGAAAALVSWQLHRSADAVVLKRTRSTPADEREHARFHNLVEGLAVAAGVPKPSLHVVDDEAPNALALGRDARHAAVVVTTGLLDKLTRIELEGVLAHELSHIRHHDTAVSTLAAAVVGRVAPGLVPSAVGERRETVADVTGVALTRYPPGLISALEKLRDDPSVLRAPDRAIAHLWIEAPLAEPTRPPLDERIQALREL